MRIFYLAHPAAADRKYNEEQNLVHARKVQLLLLEAGLVTVMPWHTWIASLGSGWDNPQIDMETFIALDKECITRFDGVILTGHRISRGMAFEMEHAVKIGKIVMDFTSIPDSQLVEAVRSWSHPLHIHGSNT